MIIYISGPMRGREDFNRPAFMEAEKRLKKAGHIVLNPAWLPVDLKSESYAPIDTAMIDAADAVYMLHGWWISRGAQAEKAYADWQQKEVIFEEDEPYEE